MSLQPFTAQRAELLAVLDPLPAEGCARTAEALPSRQPCTPTRRESREMSGRTSSKSHPLFSARPPHNAATRNQNDQPGLDFSPGVNTRAGNRSARIEREFGAISGRTAMRVYGCHMKTGWS